jgi:signal peptidase II
MGRGSLILRRPGAVAAAIVLAVVILDQATKALVRARMPLGSSIELMAPLLKLTHVRNSGAAFGMMPGRPTLFIIVSLAVLAGVGLYWWRYRPTRLPVVIALSLVAGGALGNLIDRLTSGRVTDFIEVPYIPVFNVADPCILAGVSILVWWLLFGPVDEPVADEGPAAGVAGE